VFKTVWLCVGEFYARLSTSGTIVDIQRIQDTWPELPTPLDAVMSTSRFVYFFQVWSRTYSEWVNGAGGYVPVTWVLIIEDGGISYQFEQGAGDRDITAENIIFNCRMLYFEWLNLARQFECCTANCFTQFLNTAISEPRCSRRRQTLPPCRHFANSTKPRIVFDSWPCCFCDRRANRQTDRQTYYDRNTSHPMTGDEELIKEYRLIMLFLLATDWLKTEAEVKALSHY